MRCFSPISVKVPVKPRGTRTIQAECGKCPACLTNKRNDLVLRMKNELSDHICSAFVTLTYDDSSLFYLNSDHPSLCPDHLTAFLKSLRKVLPYSIRYFGIGEYGPLTFRPHYHLIIFGLQPNDYSKVLKCWKRGIVTCTPVTDSRIGYMANFHIIKNQNLPDYVSDLCLPEFTRYSTKYGIGTRLSDDYKRYLKSNLVARNNRALVRLPRIYKEKFLDDREKLRLKRTALELSSQPYSSDDLKFANCLASQIDLMRRFRSKTKKNRYQ